MVRLFVVLLVALLAAPVSANVSREVVTTSKISTASPARYVTLYTNVFTTAATQIASRWLYPFTSARLVDVVVEQLTAGVGGTSVNVAVRKNTGTDMLATNAVITLAAGAAQETDARGALALPAGCTRPAVKSDGSEAIVKGDALYIYITETGSYSTHPTYLVTLVFEPLQ